MSIERVLLEPGSSRVAALIPLPVETRAPRAGERSVWVSTEPDWFELDRAVGEGKVVLVLSGRGSALARTTRDVLVHYQRLLPRRNRASRGFDEILRRHLAAHDLDKPLVRADYDHALDVWQWVLRLSPEASQAVQIAALFQDVERLWSEPDVRLEQHAPDYQAFKEAHARGGAESTRTMLAGAVDPVVLDRAATLIANHERPDADPERIVLNDADALSFFSINSCGFLRYYGEANTRKKLAWSRARLSPRGLRLLHALPLRSDIRAMLAKAR